MTIYAESLHGTLNVKSSGGPGGRGQDAGKGWKRCSPLGGMG
ncbi:MAG: hypothetical protein JWQ98_3536 [Chlorobi bacterium]|nr:hypothetical protein [Chlorobiota bacterium]